MWGELLVAGWELLVWVHDQAVLQEAGGNSVAVDKKV
jgi:hypothetical protein